MFEFCIQNKNLNLFATKLKQYERICELFVFDSSYFPLKTISLIYFFLSINIFWKFFQFTTFHPPLKLNLSHVHFVSTAPRKITNDWKYKKDSWTWQWAMSLSKLFETLFKRSRSLLIVSMSECLLQYSFAKPSTFFFIAIIFNWQREVVRLQYRIVDFHWKFCLF